MPTSLFRWFRDLSFGGNSYQYKVLPFGLALYGCGSGPAEAQLPGRLALFRMIMMDASLSGWGVVCQGRPACGVWSGKYFTWHINSLELRAVHLALIHFLPFLAHSLVIVRMDNMAVVFHINRQGGSWLWTLNRHVIKLLLWAQGRFLFLRAVHVPGVLNLAVDFFVKTETQVRGMDTEPPDDGSDLGIFVVAEVDLFASQESTQCLL